MKEENNLKNFCLLLKTFLKAASEFQSGFLLMIMVDFLQRMCQSRLSEQFSELQAAFGTTFRVTGGYLKAGTSFQNRFTGRMFRIS